LQHGRLLGRQRALLDVTSIHVATTFSKTWQLRQARRRTHDNHNWSPDVAVACGEATRNSGLLRRPSITTPTFTSPDVHQHFHSAPSSNLPAPVKNETKKHKNKASKQEKDKKKYSFFFGSGFFFSEPHKFDLRLRKLS
tara:strand:- start:67 stop:483 length:417 start_codon:yes stop_codon:yes gene_type:complete